MRFLLSGSQIPLTFRLKIFICLPLNRSKDVMPHQFYYTHIKMNTWFNDDTNTKNTFTIYKNKNKKIQNNKDIHHETSRLRIT